MHHVAVTLLSYSVVINSLSIQIVNVVFLKL